MFSYETGVGVSFIYWIWHSVYLIIQLNSQMERNLNRIGQRLSWLNNQPKLRTNADKSRSTGGKILKYLLLVSFSLPFVFLSWVQVSLVAAMFVYRVFKDAGAPQMVKEFRWKIRNTDMMFDQLVKEMMKLNGEDPANFEKVREETLNELIERDLAFG